MGATNNEVIILIAGSGSFSKSQDGEESNIVRLQSITHLSLFLIRCYGLERKSSFWNDSMLQSANILLNENHDQLSEAKSACRALISTDLGDILRRLTEDLSFLTLKFSESCVCCVAEYDFKEDLLGILTNLGAKICKEPYTDARNETCLATPKASTKLDALSLQVFVCTLQLMLNTRDDLAAATSMLLDDHAAFSGLRKQAKDLNMPLYQMVTSYVLRKRLGGAGYKDSWPNLDQYRPTFETFITCMEEIQDATEEITDFRECVLAIIRIIGKRVRESRSSNSLNWSVSVVTNQIKSRVDVCLRNAQLMPCKIEASSGLYGVRTLCMVQDLVDSHFVSASTVTSWSTLLSPSLTASAHIPSLQTFLKSPEEEKQVEEIKDATPQRPVEPVQPLRTLSFINQDSPVPFEQRKKNPEICEEKVGVMIYDQLEKENIPPEMSVVEEKSVKMAVLQRNNSKIQQNEKKNGNEVKTAVNLKRKAVSKKKLAFVAPQQPKITKFFGQN